MHWPWCWPRRNWRTGFTSTAWPGLVETAAPNVRGAMGAELKDITKDLPFGRACQPADVGNLCAFLCSEEGGYLSGHIIWLDGGIQW